jgi:hypothetical protein
VKPFRWWAAALVVRDLVTAAALLWLSVSDGWGPIAMSAALVASRIPGMNATGSG